MLLLLGVSLLAIIWIGVIYIIYGIELDPFFAKNVSFIEFFKLPNQFKFFSSCVLLPIVVNKLGYVSVIMLFITFTIWIFLFSIVSYLRLSQQIANKTELTLELILISLIYFFIVSPENIFLYIIGCIIIALNFVLVAIYQIYELRIKR